VQDSGIGMSADVLARASEPFFTTKDTGRGTGLGLAMARGFVEQSGGAMLIDSAPGRGTTVTLWLPLARGAGPGSPAAPQAASPATARILLVEDDLTVRQVTAESLRSAGLTVVETADGAAALALLRAGEAVDAVVSDLSMPGMDGVALVRAAQQLRPGLPAVLITGFATRSADDAIEGALPGPVALLRKPVGVQELTGRLALLLEAQRRTDQG
jgi:CheY-like chemotaxis protein